MKKALYRKIPCYYNEKTSDLMGRNMLWDILLDIVMWCDIYIVGIEEFPLWVEVDEE